MNHIPPREWMKNMCEYLLGSWYDEERKKNKNQNFSSEPKLNILSIYDAYMCKTINLGNIFFFLLKIADSDFLYTKKN